MFIRNKLILLLIMIVVPLFNQGIISCFSVCPEFVSLVGLAGSFGLLSSTSVIENVFLLTTEYTRGTLGKLMSSIYFPLDETDESYKKSDFLNVKLDFRDIDGETLTTGAALLYFYSASASRDLRNNIKRKRDLPKFPWGHVNLTEEPMAVVRKLRTYLAGKEVIEINIERADFWNLYPLAVLRRYIMLRRKRGGFKKSLNAFDNRFRFPNKNNSRLLSDFFPGKCYMKERCYKKDHPRVSYKDPTWDYTKNDSYSFLRSIYRYLKHVRSVIDMDSLSLPKSLIASSNAGLFCLAVVLYQRELQYEVGIIENKNFSSRKIAQWWKSFKQGIFRIFDVGRLTYDGKKTGKPMSRAVWKQFSDSLWKTSPIQSWISSVDKVGLNEIGEVKYNTRKWNEHDYVIGAAYYYISRLQGLPSVYGQHVIKKRYLKRLNNAQNLAQDQYPTGCSENGWPHSNIPKDIVKRDQKVRNNNLKAVNKDSPRSVSGSLRSSTSESLRSAESLDSPVEIREAKKAKSNDYSVLFDELNNNNSDIFNSEQGSIADDSSVSSLSEEIIPSKRNNTPEVDSTQIKMPLFRYGPNDDGLIHVYYHDGKSGHAEIPTDPNAKLKKRKKPTSKDSGVKRIHKHHSTDERSKRKSKSSSRPSSSKELLDMPELPDSSLMEVQSTTLKAYGKKPKQPKDSLSMDSLLSTD